MAPVSAITIALSLVFFVLLTMGTAVFVAAEFSLTALERSTVDANARSGGKRDKMAAPNWVSRSPRWPPASWLNRCSRGCWSRR